MEAPGEAWLEGGPYEWAFHSFWKVDSLIDSFYDAMDTVETNKKIGFALGNDTDGVLFAKVMSEKAAARGYEIVDPGRFPINTKDYTTLISELKKANCDIVYGNMITPDFMTMYKQFHQQGYVPKMLAMSRAILFPADVEAIGGIAEGLMAEVWWSETHPYKSSLTGETPKDLAEKYTKQTSKQPSAAIGYKHANVEIAIDVLKRAQSLDKEAIRQAIAETDLDTIVGHIKFDDQNFSELNVTIGQWQKGDKWPFEMVIINNNKQPEVPVSSKPVIFPLPGTTQK
jgi:branched-chain amino acid transport system substrate-binding protein